MRRLVCVCVIRKPPKTGFRVSRPKIALSSLAERFLAQQEKFQNEIMSVLSTISKNQTEPNKRLKQSESKLAEFENQGFLTGCLRKVYCTL